MKEINDIIAAYYQAIQQAKGPCWQQWLGSKVRHTEDLGHAY